MVTTGIVSFHLARRGIPFKEYDVNNSIKGKADYKKLNGRGVPIILVGKQRTVKTNKNYTLQLQMFPAHSTEEAYNKALEILEGFDDSNHDGEGDLYKEKGIGIYQLESICNFNEFNEKINDLYGLDSGLVELSELSKTEKPIIREKLGLDVFK